MSAGGQGAEVCSGERLLAPELSVGGSPWCHDGENQGQGLWEETP